MNEPFDSSTAEADALKPRKLRHKWWLIGGIALISLHLLVVMGYATLDFVYNVLPQESYREIYKAPWVKSNVRALNFQTVADFAKAEDTLDQQSRQKGNQDSPVPHFLLAELYNTLGKPENAVLEYKKTIQLSKGNWWSGLRYQEFSDNAHAALAILYYEQGKSSQAQQELADITEANENREADILLAMQDALDEPERGDFHLVLGKAFRRELKLKMANRELQQAVRLSQNPQVRMEAENFLKSQMPQGLQELSPLARYYGLAARSAQTNDENLPKAASLFRKALKEDPGFDWGYNELAIIYREMKDYPLATAYARNAITQNTDFYNPHLTLGDIALDQENYQAAIQHFQEAEAILQRLPQDDQQGLVANIENQIAYSYESLHRYAEAAQHYQSALSLSSESGDDATDDYGYAQDGLARIADAQKENASKAASTSGKQLSWKK